MKWKKSLREGGVCVVISASGVLLYHMTAYVYSHSVLSIANRALNQLATVHSLNPSPRSLLLYIQFPTPPLN